jgi:hypothetical protein
MLNITLKVPLGPFAIRGLRQGNHAGGTHRQVLGDAIDRAVLAGSVAPLQDKHDAITRLHRDCLRLQ